MTSTTTSTKSYSNVVKTWLQIPPNFAEGNLEALLMTVMWQALGLTVNQVKKNPNIGGGCIPDWLIYQDPTQPPVLVIEDKKRVKVLAEAPDDQFIDLCKKNSLYKDAVGYPVAHGNNGIKQYLDKDKVSPNCLASYGLVFNGDFFQLWRRVDGLVFPLTPIQRVTKKSIPLLMQQLNYCLNHPQSALVSAIWNQKGGVAKTTNIINVGATLALKDKKVLLIDLDPQGDLGRWLGVHHRSDYLNSCIEKIDAHKIDEAENILNSAVHTKIFPTTDGKNYELSVLSTDSESLKKFRDASHLNQPHILFKKMVKLVKQKYDYILIDIAPTLDRLAQCVLFTCDTVLIPVDYGEKSLHHGLQIHQSLVPKLRESRSKGEQLHVGPWNLGIVFSNCPSDPGSALQGLIDQNLKSKGFAGNRCQTHLRAYTQTKVAEFKRAPAICWQASPITKLYAQLTNEVFLNHNFTDH
ncbi:AAA family ATPase [Trichocoleus sp. FACHB-591]|uniref:ParA family protein n=1 Tax=Trichocoleus sp. FACHB-591 TaxID=2692872 RepID=UPI0016867A0C|nr:AAA family ATPase [Trichocoleus sp. FACHB-591]MBD2097072.1 AAA family ATPase [Trichocoleus sp. FACHB-591]